MLKKIVTSLVLLSCMNGYAQQWPLVHKETKPWTRWWWMGSAVDEKGINKQLNSLSQQGFGGVEIVPIYGSIGYENKYINYLSPQWMHILDYTVKQSRALHMGVDMSVGTGWPIGGPQVSVKDAATKLIVQIYSIKAHEILQEKIVLNDVKQRNLPGTFLTAVTAYDEHGKALVITDKVTADGTLEWIPDEGKWTIYAAFVGKTKQAVKRAAAGGEGYTLDHFSGTALNDYFKTFDTAFGNSSHGVRSFFNDSYEVFGADWTPDFFNEFKKRRGYDLQPYIRQLVSKSSDELTARIKCDYRETMSELMLQNFTQNFTKWAHSKQAMNTNQAHGSPGNLLDLYAAVDMPESETFGSTAFQIPGLRRDPEDVRNVDPDPNMLKFASSAAHAMGKQFTSNETFTWLTEHFKTSWSQCKPEVEQVFLAGINHVFYHGTTYSPPNIPWPGWLFYASVNFVPNNSLWPHVNGLNEYITRCQSVLQSGEPDNEIAAYWPVYDAWSNPEGLDMPFKIHDINEWLHPTAFYKNLVSLQQKGYSIDFTSDKMLSDATVHAGNIQLSAKGAKHKVLLVSACEYMPVHTLQQIIRLAKEGAIVVLQSFPKDVPGFYKLEERRNELKALINSIVFNEKGACKEAVLGKGRIILSDDVHKGLETAGVSGEKLTDEGLKFIRRQLTHGKYYYIVNHSAHAVDKIIPLNTMASAVAFLDPQTGEKGYVSFAEKNRTTEVRLQLQPGQAIIIQTKTTAIDGPKWNYTTTASEPILLKNPWKLHFVTGGPFMPADKIMDHLQPWTNFANDTATQSFSGTGVYSTSFHLKQKKADDYVLQLDKVYESARVLVNGNDAGIAWSIPFQLNIGKYLKEGKNTIEIEVCNLMANRIRYMDQNKIEWRKYHEINFVNINYKNFDASHWNVQASGLDGSIKIVPVKYEK
ncbi:MAG: glycoside hydrolase [Bacteroidota bacterium]|nr:glycoside hydrolase [Bacteroidota bacterium]